MTSKASNPISPIVDRGANQGTNRGANQGTNRGANREENRELIRNMLIFALPYLLSCFLQNFYGMADLFIIGQFNGAEVITAVSTGSQIIHMLTVVITGLAMGTTVMIGQAVGARRPERIQKTAGNSVLIFALLAVVLTILLTGLVDGILSAVATPAESMQAAHQYLYVCFLGIPFIVAYNVLSSMFRGLGDSRSPMIFVAIAGVINIVLDYILVGPCQMGARGAAIATIVSQAISVLLAILALIKFDLGIHLNREALRPEKAAISSVVRIGLPIACQDGFIQISFLIITAIANGRGVTMAASVGIVEKIITFLFLVNSAMLSTISAIAAQKIGAGRTDQARKVLGYGILMAAGFGVLAVLVVEPLAPQILSLFVKDDEMVVLLGAGYFRAYIFDCIFAGIHFSFSGYFCACGRSILSFIHNVVSIILIRIPGAYLTSKLFPATLVPMGIVTPAGSFVSAVLCVIMYLWLLKKTGKEGISREK